MDVHGATLWQRGLKLYVHEAKAEHKIEALAPMIRYASPLMQSVIAFGRCCPTKSGPEAMTQLKQFAMMYFPEIQFADEEITRIEKSVQLFEIEIEYLSGKKFRSGDPLCTAVKSCLTHF